jgi:hypothetical protein
LRMMREAWHEDRHRRHGQNARQGGRRLDRHSRLRR